MNRRVKKIKIFGAYNSDRLESDVEHYIQHEMDATKYAVCDVQFQMNSNDTMMRTWHSAMLILCSVAEPTDKNN